jgi:hypothetical protein
MVKSIQYTYEQLGLVLRVMQAVVAAELAREGPRTKQNATTTAKTVIDMVKAVIHCVAKTPSIAGDTRGVSLENAQMYATKVRDSLVEISGQTRGAAPTPTTQYLSTKIGWQTLSLATTTYMDIVSGLANVENDRGQITSAAVATALPVKAQYYPVALATILGEIQARYDGLGIPDEAAQLLGRIMQDGDLRGAMAMNGPCGHFQCAVPIIQRAVTELPQQMYRRDPRPVFDGQGNQVNLDVKVIPFATYVMRAALTSALEMSIELGDVRRLTKSGAVGAAGAGAGPKTTFEIRYDTPFAKLIELALHTKRYFNPAGPKDLALLISESGDRYNIHNTGGPKGLSTDANGEAKAIAWKSLKANPQGYYNFGTASLVLEVETRLRISEYNNDLAVVPPGAEAGPAKPSSKDIKVPNFTYFMKAPRELIEAVSIAANFHSFDQFKAEANLRQDTARRIKAIFDSRAGNYQAFVAEITNLAQGIEHTCELITLMHHVRLIGESSRRAAAAKAKNTKEPRS